MRLWPQRTTGPVGNGYRLGPASKGSPNWTQRGPWYQREENQGSVSRGDVAHSLWEHSPNTKET